MLLFLILIVIASVRTQGNQDLKSFYNIRIFNEQSFNFFSRTKTSLLIFLQNVGSWRNCQPHYHLRISTNCLWTSKPFWVTMSKKAHWNWIIQFCRERGSKGTHLNFHPKKFDLPQITYSIPTSTFTSTPRVLNW